MFDGFTEGRELDKTKKIVALTITMNCRMFFLQVVQGLYHGNGQGAENLDFDRHSKRSKYFIETSQHKFHHNPYWCIRADCAWNVYVSAVYVILFEEFYFATLQGHSKKSCQLFRLRNCYKLSLSLTEVLDYWATVRLHHHAQIHSQTLNRLLVIKKRHETHLHLILIVWFGYLFHSHVFHFEFLLENGARCPTAQKAITVLGEIALGYILVDDSVNFNRPKTGQGNIFMVKSTSVCIAETAPVRIQVKTRNYIIEPTR